MICLATPHFWLGHSLRCTENWKLNPEFSGFSFQFCSKTLAAGTFLDWKLNLEFSVHWIQGPWTWSRGNPWTWSRKCIVRPVDVVNSPSCCSTFCENLGDISLWVFSFQFSVPVTSAFQLDWIHLRTGLTNKFWAGFSFQFSVHRNEWPKPFCDYYTTCKPPREDDDQTI